MDARGILLKVLRTGTAFFSQLADTMERKIFTLAANWAIIGRPRLKEANHEKETISSLTRKELKRKRIRFRLD